MNGSKHHRRTHAIPREIIGHILSFINQCTTSRFLVDMATYYFDVAEAMSYGFFVHPMSRCDGLHDTILAAIHRRRYDLTYIIALAATGYDRSSYIDPGAAYLSDDHIVLYDILHAVSRDRRAYAMIMMIDRIRATIPPRDVIIALRDYARTVRSYFMRCPDERVSHPGERVSHPGEQMSHPKSLKLVYDDCMYRGDEDDATAISDIVFADVATWGIDTFYPPAVDEFYNASKGIDVVKKMAGRPYICHISEMKPCAETCLSVSPCGYVYRDVDISGSFYEGDSAAMDMAIIYRLAIGDDPRDVYEDWEGITSYDGEIAIACIINIYKAYLVDEMSITIDPPMNGVHSALPTGVMETWVHPSHRPLPDMTVCPHRNDYRHLRSMLARAKKYAKG